MRLGLPGVLQIIVRHSLECHLNYRCYLRYPMPRVELKLKQASAVLGVPQKALQNLVQARVLKPRRRLGLYYFDTSLLLQATVALYLKNRWGPRRVTSRSLPTRSHSCPASRPVRLPWCDSGRARGRATRPSRSGSLSVLWLRNSAAGYRLQRSRGTFLPDASASGGSVISLPPFEKPRSI